METIKFEPWVGNNYAVGKYGKRVLVLGESRYQWVKDEPIDGWSDLTIECVKEPASREEAVEAGSIEYLAPGDFKVVYQQQRFRKPESVTHRLLIEGLRAEVRSKNGNPGKKMGFR